MKITLPNGTTIETDEAVVIGGITIEPVVYEDDAQSETDNVEVPDQEEAPFDEEEVESESADEPYKANAEHRLTLNQRRSLDYLRACPEWTCSVSSFARDNAVSNAAASERLRTLVRLGLAEHVLYRAGLYRGLTYRELREADGVLVG